MISPLPDSKQDVLSALKAEVVGQCWRAVVAWGSLIPLVGTMTLSYDEDDPMGREQAITNHRVEIQNCVHTILSAAGVVSRILWPPPPPRRLLGLPTSRRRIERAARAQARARRIWKEWSLPPSKTLRPLRSQRVRNASEHAENDAADWFEKQPSGPLAEFQTGRTRVPEGERGPGLTFRYLFVDTPDLRIKVGDESCSLGQLVACLVLVEQSLVKKIHILSAIGMIPRSRTEPHFSQVTFCPLGLSPHRVR